MSKRRVLAAVERVKDGLLALAPDGRIDAADGTRPTRLPQHLGDPERANCGLRNSSCSENRVTSTVAGKVWLPFVPFGENSLFPGKQEGKGFAVVKTEVCGT